MKRWLALFALIAGLVWLGLAIQSRRRTLSAEEIRLVGTWNWTMVAPARQALVTFAPDRTFNAPGTKGLNSRWSVRKGRLTIDHIYKAVLFPGIPNALPMTHTESYSWTIHFTEHSNEIKLKPENNLADSVLVRSDN